MASCKYDSIAKQFQGIFTNETIKELPIDSCTVNTPRTVPSACFTEVEPTPLSQPVLVAASTSALALIDLDLGAEDADELAAWFSGNVTITGAHPHAHCYAGHQYGYFNGQLGDGANLYYGDITNRLGEKWQLQLKGTGPTPYSRAGTDGRKVLRSSIREFLCSEAMYHLGVPTTRAATCVVGSDTVTRDKNYDGKLKPERAAVVSRIAPTFLRIGSLEICKLKDAVSKREGPSAGNAALLRSMLDFTIKMYYPEIQAKEASEEMRYISFFEAFVLRTARLVAQWQCLGFGHGVLNTDNISLVGVTLDYGPFSFMGTYDPDHIPNASDHWAIFRYGKQPDQCKWCINKMAEVLELILPPEKLNSAVTLFDAEFEKHYMKQMGKKLGLKEHRDDDRQLVDELLDTMAKTGADFHKTFRLLSSYPGRSVTEDVLQHCCSADDLRHIYRKREYPTEE